MRLALALCLGVASCGAAPTPHEGPAAHLGDGALREGPPECAGDGEEGAVAAALRAYARDAELGGASFWNQVLRCAVTTERGVITLSPDAYPGSEEPFAWSCWTRGGPEDGQCGAFGQGRGAALAMPPEPPAGTHDFVREWLTRMAQVEGEAVVIVTVGDHAQAHEAVVVRDRGVWRVVELRLAWTT